MSLSSSSTKEFPEIESYFITRLYAGSNNYILYAVRLAVVKHYLLCDKLATYCLLVDYRLVGAASYWSFNIVTYTVVGSLIEVIMF